MAAKPVSTWYARQRTQLINHINNDRRPGGPFVDITGQPPRLSRATEQLSFGWVFKGDGPTDLNLHKLFHCQGAGGRYLDEVKKYRKPLSGAERPDQHVSVLQCGPTKRRSGP